MRWDVSKSRNAISLLTFSLFIRPRPSLCSFLQLLNTSWKFTDYNNLAQMRKRSEHQCYSSNRSAAVPLTVAQWRAAARSVCLVFINKFCIVWFFKGLRGISMWRLPPHVWSPSRHHRWTFMSDNINRKIDHEIAFL